MGPALMGPVWAKVGACPRALPRLRRRRRLARLRRVQVWPWLAATLHFAGGRRLVRAGKRDEQDHRVTITKREENSSPHPDHDGSFAGLLPAYVENLRLVRVEVTGIPVALCGVGPVLLRGDETGQIPSRRICRASRKVEGTVQQAIFAPHRCRGNLYGPGSDCMPATAIEAI